MQSIVMALFVAAGGWNASARFYEALIPQIGLLMLMFIFFGSWYPLMVLTFWYLFTLGASPYPLLAAVLVAFTFLQFCLTLQMGFVGSSMPLARARCTSSS